MTRSKRKPPVSPAEQIVAYADGVDATRLAGHSRTPAGKAVFGSVSQSVMLDGETPVLFFDGETPVLFPPTTEP